MFTGETALSVAKTSNLKRLIKEAWTDQSNCSQLSLDLTSDSNHSIEHNTGSHDQLESHEHLGSHDVVQDGSHDANQSTSNTMASSSIKRSCFITQVSVIYVGVAHVISCDLQAGTPLSSPPMEEHPCVSSSYCDNNLLPHLDSDIHYHADVETDCGPSLQHNDNSTSSSKQQHKQKIQSEEQQKHSGQCRTRKLSLEGKDLDSQKSKVTLRKQNSVDEKSSASTHQQELSSHVVATATSSTNATAKLSKSNSSGASYSVTKKKHQQLSGSVHRSHSGSTLYQQQHNGNSRLPVVKSCSGK